MFRNFNYTFLGGAFTYVVTVIFVSGDCIFESDGTECGSNLLVADGRCTPSTLCIPGSLPQFLAFAENVLG